MWIQKMRPRIFGVFIFPRTTVRNLVVIVAHDNNRKLLWDPCRTLILGIIFGGFAGRALEPGNYFQRGRRSQVAPSFPFSFLRHFRTLISLIEN